MRVSTQSASGSTIWQIVDGRLADRVITQDGGRTIDADTLARFERRLTDHDPKASLAVDPDDPTIIRVYGLDDHPASHIAINRALYDLLGEPSHDLAGVS